MLWDKRPWPERAGDAVSQLLNVWLFNGMPDESLSGRSYRMTVVATMQGQKTSMLWWFVADFAEILFWWRDRGDHCRLAYVEDISRAAARLRSLR